MTNILGTPPSQQSINGEMTRYVETGATVVSPQEYTQQYPMSLSRSDGKTPVNFPGVIFREEASNSLSVHTYPNQPNARVENMGQDPTKYHVRAALTNNINPGTTEGWKRGTLFPANPNLTNSYSVFDLLRTLLAEPGNKIFTHPWDGNVTVQVVSWSYEMVSDKMRDGVFFDINLITTIPDSTPLMATLPPSKAGGLASAASTVESALLAIAFLAQGYATSAYNLPGVNLSGFFNSIADTINFSVSTPTLAVPALGLSINTQNTSIVGGNIGNTPSYLANNTLTFTQQNQTILGAPSVNQLQPSTASVYNAMQSITTLNSQPAQNISQMLQNTQRMLVDLTQFYIDQNASAASSMIEALKQMNYQVLQQLNTLNSSSQVYTQVLSFVTKQPMSFMSIAQIYQQSIDDILSLNQTLVTRAFVETNQTVYYYQVT